MVIFYIGYREEQEIATPTEIKIMHKEKVIIWNRCSI